MSRFPSFPTLDLTAFDLSKLPRIELPKLPKIDLPKLDLRKVDDRVIDVVKNAAYLTVGLAVTAAQRVTKIAA